jgi:hypothetical protein
MDELRSRYRRFFASLDCRTTCVKILKRDAVQCTGTIKVTLNYEASSLTPSHPIGHSLNKPSMSHLLLCVSTTVLLSTLLSQQLAVAIDK